MLTKGPESARRALVALAVLLAACGGEEPGDPPPAQLTDLTRHAVHVGLDESGSAQGALGKVVAARVTDGGRHVVVLDFVAPFVKVFDGRGRLESAFVGTGGGPAEARHPSALAVAGDSLVLVADGRNGITVYDLRGTIRSHARPNGIVPLAAASCPGEWVLYGPRMDGASAEARVTPWVHRLRFVGADSVEVRSAWPDTVPEFVSAGLAYGMVRDGRDVVLWHTGGSRTRGLRVPCGGGKPREVYVGEPSNRAAPKDGPGGSVQTSVPAGTRAAAGVAAVGQGVVFGERVFVSPEHPRVDFTLLAGGLARTLSIAGDFVLNDSRPGDGVLMSTSDPVPQLFLVKPDDFLGMFPAP
ncbi:hypothetical protein [Longimicrobium sp.]|uniref:hypothetical protein n=1 Tax=Longimicrobium sp. TaxID=2029185 RepID=UPI002E36400B|nr:hypothetical protein [Longimicrobium sp.]HEX6036819.1 hypothetical protein [Longimicrobium sp.]